MTDLPPPPTFEHLLLENPYPLGFCLAALGATLLIISLRRASRMHRHLAIGCGIATLGVMLLASWIQTDREAIREATESLVHAVARADRSELEIRMHPDITLISGKSRSGRDWLIDAIDLAMKRHSTEDVSVRQLDAVADAPDFGRATLMVVAHSPKGGFAKTDWLLSWKRDPTHGWQLTEARLVKLNNQPVTFWILP